MRIQRFALPAVAVLAALAMSTPRVNAAPAQAYYQQPGWDMPPNEYNEVQRLGFHDGVEGARKDYDNRRRPDVNNRDEYREPHVAFRLRRAYRDAFRRGYEVGVSHLWQASQPVAPPQQPAMQYEWGMRGLRSDAERQGFREGVEHARRDYSQQRRPDPDDSRDYQQPPVPPEVVEEYRQGFMRGYEVAYSQLSGQGQWQGGGDPDSWAPQRFSELQRRGFHDGVEGAHRDADNHRPPNPANRDEYRRPHVPENMWNEYREGFRRGLRDDGGADVRSAVERRLGNAEGARGCPSA